MLKNSISEIIFVNRINYLKELCRGKKVLHLGATDSPVTKEAIQKGYLLHLHLNKVSDYLVGLDLDVSMIQWLSDNYDIDTIKHGNIEEPENYPKADFDIVIAGEIFEHLSNPGKALDCIRSILKFPSVLVITVPNAYSIKGFLRALMKHELIHPDHILHHSPHTLKTLLERHGFSVSSYFSYVNGGTGPIASITNQFIRFNSQLAEGIGVICTPK
jgi:2-polyprenyl-3-methyl-5-hydroxy-6-metoxy-1,4-benzoquinol methylase